MPEASSFLPLLPPGLRAFALYVQAHYLYLKEEYAYSAGIVEAALAMDASRYPIPAIYLHLVAVMDYMSLKQPDRAKKHLLTAWGIARPDDLIEDVYKRQESQLLNSLIIIPQGAVLVNNFPFFLLFISVR